jgi:hypothetical protein
MKTTIKNVHLSIYKDLRRSNEDRKYLRTFIGTEDGGVIFCKQK